MIRVFLLWTGVLATVLAAAASALDPIGTPELLSGVPADYVIVLPEQPTTQEQFTADWLAGHLRRLFRAEFPVIREPVEAGSHRICIGRTKAATAAGANEAPGEQSYRLVRSGADLFLLGGDRGPFNAAAAWLEEDLGVRWYAPDQSATDPATPELRVTPRSWNPPFAVREPLYWTVMGQPDWALFNRLQPLSHHLVLPPDAGVAIGGGEYFVHTYFKLVPAEKYFAAHPEYFPLRGGARRPSTPYEGQLCYTNPDLPGVMAEALRQAIRARPELRIFSVSANDTLIQQCECPDCAALIQREGISGAQLQLTNRVAELLRKEFPDIRLTMLAYTNSQTPPPTLRPGAGVEIFYAPYTHRHNPTATLLPIQELPAVTAELAAWRDRGSRILFWDYSDYDVTPPMLCPSFDAQDAGLRFLAGIGVDGVFLEGSHTYPGSLDALKSWVFAKKLWNPAWAIDALVDEFLDGYYGPAAPEMKRYVTLQREAWRVFHATQSSGCSTPLPWPDRRLEDLRQALRQAEAACADAPDFRRRVRAEWLPFLTQTLARNPRVAGVETYAADLVLAEKLLAENPGSPLPGAGIVERWRSKLAWAQTPPEADLYSPGTLRIWPPQTPLAEVVDDPTALNAERKAVRQTGGSDWGVQWNFDAFLDRVIPEREYVVRLRVCTESTRSRPADAAMCRIRVHIFGDEARTAGASSYTVPAGNGTYCWVTLGRLKVEHPTATGFLYTLPAADLIGNDALRFDRLELIPVDEYRESDGASRLPLIAI